MSRRWRRDGRIFRFDCPDAQGFIFGAQAPSCMWAWAVYGSHFKAEGVEFSLVVAKRRANEQLDKLLNLAPHCKPSAPPRSNPDRPS